MVRVITHRCKHIGYEHKAVDLLPMSFLVKPGERLRLEISNFDSLIVDAPMTQWYGQKVGTDTYYRDATHPSRLILPHCPK